MFLQRRAGVIETGRRPWLQLPDPDFQALKKAPLLTFEPCVGCGWCCLTDPCWVSHWRHGHTRRCPELYWDGELGRYMCAAMDDPEHGDYARRKLFEGEGCCAPDNAFRKNVRNRDGE